MVWLWLFVRGGSGGRQMSIPAVLVNLSHVELMRREGTVQQESLMNAEQHAGGVGGTRQEAIGLIIHNL